MTDKKISDLPSALSVSASDAIEILQSGVSKQATLQKLASLVPGTPGATGPQGAVGPAGPTGPQGPAGVITFANPIASTGLAAVNGSASTAMRSDAAPALDVSISPTWSGTHTFNTTPVVPAASWTYAKIQNVSATSRILGRITAGAGTIEELTGTQATTLLDTFTTALKGLAPASGGGTTNFLRADGTWAVAGSPPGGSTNGDIQYKSGSSFAASDNFSYTESLDTGGGYFPSIMQVGLNTTEAAIFGTGQLTISAFGSKVTSGANYFDYFTNGYFQVIPNNGTNGGAVWMVSGNAPSNGAGGTLIIEAGDAAGAGNNNGGEVNIRSGNKTNAGRPGDILFQTAVSNTRLKIFGVDGGVTVGSPAGNSQGAGTLNAQGLYVQGVAVTTGGAVFTIGDIVYGNTAPTDGGTWLQLNGQSVSQSTYSTLFGILGQDYLQYKLVKGTNPSAAFTASTLTIYDGTKWIAVTNGSASTFTSSDGLTWAGGGNLATALTSQILWTNGTGTVLVYNAATTTANISTDHGVTWSAVTLSATGAWVMANNGANVVALKANSTAIMASTDGGATWATSGSTLPVTPTNLRTLWYDGTQWVALSTGATSAVQHLKSAVANGQSGWANTFTTAGAPTVSIPLAIPGTQKLIGDFGSVGAFFSTNSGDTYTLAGFPALTPTTPTTLIWNGLHYIAPTMAAATGAGKYRIINSTVTNYYTDVPYVSADTPFAGAANASFITNLSIPANSTGSAYHRVDLVNRRAVVLIQQDLTGGGNAFTPYTVEPNINTSTNFNVPNTAYMGTNNQPNLTFNKAWIKAL